MIISSRGDLESILTDAMDGRVGPFAADVTSFSAVKAFMSAQLETPLTEALSNKLRNYWGARSRAVMCKSQIRVDEGGMSRHRVRSIRNHKHWYVADAEALKHELTRSLHLMLGKQAEPPRLKEVRKK